MPIDDIRAMPAEDLATELYETRRELMNLRFRAATMQLSNVNEISRTKKAGRADPDGDARARAKTDHII